MPFFFVSFYGLKSFCQALPQFVRVMTFNFGAEIPGLICGFVFFYDVDFLVSRVRCHSKRRVAVNVFSMQGLTAENTWSSSFLA
jgi:hypothetical protein